MVCFHFQPTYLCAQTPQNYIFILQATETLSCLPLSPCVSCLYHHVNCFSGTYSCVLFLTVNWLVLWMATNNSKLESSSAELMSFTVSKKQCCHHSYFTIDSNDQFHFVVIRLLILLLVLSLLKLFVYVCFEWPNGPPTDLTGAMSLVTALMLLSTSMWGCGYEITPLH